MQKYLRPEQKERRGSRMICYAVIDTNVFISALLSDGTCGSQGVWGRGFSAANGRNFG